MFPNLRGFLYALAICTVSRGHNLPTLTTRDVPSLVGHCAERGLVLRVRIGFCDDRCFQEMDGESRLVKTDFENHCSSFLSTTVGPTVVTYCSLCSSLIKS